MKKLTKEIFERDAKRDLGAELLEAIREIKAGGGRRFSVNVSQATEARFTLGMSQAEFAKMLGVSALVGRISIRRLREKRWVKTHATLLCPTQDHRKSTQSRTRFGHAQTTHHAQHHLLRTRRMESAIRRKAGLTEYGCYALAKQVPYSVGRAPLVRQSLLWHDSRSPAKPLRMRADLYSSESPLSKTPKWFPTHVRSGRGMPAHCRDRSSDKSTEGASYALLQ